jgi:hypothetical protein
MNCFSLCRQQPMPTPAPPAEATNDNNNDMEPSNEEPRIEW